MAKEEAHVIHLRIDDYLRSVRCVLCNATHAERASSERQAMAMACANARLAGWRRVKRTGGWFCPECVEDLREALA